MDLPYPFNSAKRMYADDLGRIALVDGSGKVLVRLPLDAAFDLLNQGKDWHGNPYGSIDGEGVGQGYYGVSDLRGYGIGKGVRP